MHIKLTANKSLYQVSATTPPPLSDSKPQNLEPLVRLLSDVLVEKEILKTNIKATLIKLNIKVTLEVILKY